MIKTSDLGAIVTALGELIGLLTPGSDANTVDVNTAWFSDPLTELQAVNTRLNDLVTIIDATLGPSSDSAPALFTDAQWYPLPNPATGTPTVFHVVTPKPTDTSGQIGLGVFYPFQGGSVAVQAFVYVPLFSFSSSGAQFIANSQAHPAQIGLYATSAEGFQVGAVSFSALNLDASIYLADQAPTIQLVFAELTGTSKPNTYTSLSSLLDSDVETWLGEVIVQGSSWLSVYLGSAPYTPGDILEAANFLSRNYLLVPGDFTNLPSLVQKLTNPSSDPVAPQVSAFLWSQFSSASQQILSNPSSTTDQQQSVLVEELNTVVQGPSIYDPQRFADVALSPQTSNLLDQNPQGAALIQLNRLLLQAAYGQEIAASAYNLNLENLQGSATEIALNFVFAVLNAFATLDIPIVTLSGGGIYIERRDNSDQSSDYGLRVAVDLALTSGGSDNGTPSPAIDLCLGTWLTGETDSNNWIKRSNSSHVSAATDPGVAVFVLRRDSSQALSFAPSFQLSSVGLNIKGSSAAPLINLSGYVLNGADLRAYLDSTDWTFGFACRLDDLGVPLGPGFGTAVADSHTNPVAQSLLQSGSGGGGDQNPVNPAFSVSAAFVEYGSFVVQLYDQNGAPASQVLIPIQQALGPLQCEKLGIGWVQDTSNAANNRLSLLFDGGLSLGGLAVDLMGLSIGIPVTAPDDFSKYDLDLNGLGITFAQAEVELSAALVKLGPDPTASPPRNYIEYDGEALLKAGTFVISALGSYAYVPDATNGKGYASLFIFGIFDGNLGGPAFFFVTGLAAGFGYNRALILPDQNSVTTFPLVAAASDPSALGGQQQPNGSWKMPDPATALMHLDQYVPPQRGEYWLAAGVRFTSFDLIHSTALLIVEFGNELEIALLGSSWISLPPPASPAASAPVERYAYAELGLEVKLLPSEGVFSATAILSSNSFVIDPACRLTGGFAFYVWFGDNPHAGEFVLTLGGYHPDFQPPNYYPSVPRLGFNWPLPGDVTISGDAYFALTPSAVMAGAGLQVLYSSGNLKAWFKAQMDALIQWAPFHYLIDIGVSIGASYRAHLLFVTVTLKVELGANLTIWGPKMGGKVHINWYVISFTVAFGADPSQEPQPLDWTNQDGTGFAQTLLPNTTQTAAQSPQFAAALTGTMAALEANDAVQPSGIYTIAVNDGLLKTFTDASGQTIWVVRGNHFVCSITTTIPATEVAITAAQGEDPSTQTTFTPQDACQAGSDYFVCIRPMKATLASSVFTITMTQDDDSTIYDLAGDFDFDVACHAVPAAKWGKPLPKGQDPEMNAQLPNRLLGLENITPKQPVLTPSGADVLYIDVATAFTYDVVDGETPYTPNHLPLQTGQTPVGPVPQVDENAIQTIHASLMDSNVVAARNDIFAALQEYGIDPVTNGTLETFAKDPGAVLSGNPLILPA